MYRTIVSLMGILLSTEALLRITKKVQSQWSQKFTNVLSMTVSLQTMFLP